MSKDGLWFLFSQVSGFTVTLMHSPFSLEILNLQVVFWTLLVWLRLSPCMSDLVFTEQSCWGQRVFMLNTVCLYLHSFCVTVRVCASLTPY